MASILDDIVDSDQLQCAPAAPNTTLMPLALLMDRDPSLDSDANLSSGSDEDEDTQTPPTAQNSPETVTTFAVNTTQNL